MILTCNDSLESLNMNGLFLKKVLENGLIEAFKLKSIIQHGLYKKQFVLVFCYSSDRSFPIQIKLTETTFYLL